MLLQTFIECLLCRSTADGYLMARQKRPSRSKQRDKVCDDRLTICEDSKSDTFLESYT